MADDEINAECDHCKKPWSVNLSGPDGGRPSDDEVECRIHLLAEKGWHSDADVVRRLLAWTRATEQDRDNWKLSAEGYAHALELADKRVVKLEETLMKLALERDQLRAELSEAKAQRDDATDLLRQAFDKDQNSDELYAWPPELYSSVKFFLRRIVDAGGEGGNG